MNVHHVLLDSDCLFCTLDSCFVDIFTARQRSGEGNFFTRICLSLCLSIVRRGVPTQGPGLPLHWASIPPLPLDTALVPVPPPQTCSNLFNLDLSVHGPTPLPSVDTFKRVHFKAQTVRKWAVGIRTKCLLVYSFFFIFIQ